MFFLTSSTFLCISQSLWLIIYITSCIEEIFWDFPRYVLREKPHQMLTFFSQKLFFIFHIFITFFSHFNSFLNTGDFLYIQYYYFTKFLLITVKRVLYGVCFFLLSGLIILFVSFIAVSLVATAASKCLLCLAAFHVCGSVLFRDCSIQFCFLYFLCSVSALFSARFYKIY